MASTVFQKDHVFQCLVIMNYISYSSCLLILFPYALNLLMQYNCLSEITVANWFPVATSKDIFSQIFCSTNSVSSPTKFKKKKSSFLCHSYSKECACECDLPVFLQLCALLFEMGCAWCLHENDLIFKRSEKDLKNPYSWGNLWNISFLV